MICREFAFGPFSEEVPQAMQANAHPYTVVWLFSSPNPREKACELGIDCLTQRQLEKVHKITSRGAEEKSRALFGAGTGRFW